MVSVILVLSLGTFFTSVHTNPCKNYTVIDDPYRSTAYKWVPGTPALCDRNLQIGWYRFTSSVGGMMPTTRPKPKHCGTIAPIYITNHPTTESPYDEFPACFNFYNRIECPFWLLIPVIKCPKGFYVYKLKPVHGCYIAYCAGNKKPCPRGWSGLDGNCTALPMALSSDSFEQPSIAYRDTEDLNEGVTLLCRAVLKENVFEWKNVTYEVEWFVNGISVENKAFCYPYGNEVPLNNKSCPGRKIYTAELGPSRYKLGNWVSCRIRARFSTNPSNQWVEKESEKFFAGIKVEPSTIDLKECSKANYNIHCGYKSWLQWDEKLCNILKNADSPMFAIQPTIPIPRTDITFRVPEGLLLDRCNLELQGTKQELVNITTQCNLMESTESLDTSYIVIINNTQFAASHTPLGIIKVNIQKTRIEFCSSNTDPHFWTFDGYKYDHMELGDFVFYRNEERNFEIQTRQWLCNDWPDKKNTKASCNCATIIRDNNDVIEFNCCNEEKVYNNVTPLRKRIRSKGPLAHSTTIKQVLPITHDARYILTFESGIRLALYRNRYGLNIYLNVPHNNKKHFGMCGNYNGKIDDEFKIFSQENEVPKVYDDPVALGTEYKKDDQENLFDNPNRHYNDSRKMHHNIRTCACKSTSEDTGVQCNAGENIVNYHYLTLRRTIQVNLLSQSGNSKRDILYSDALEDEDFDMFMKPDPWEPHFRSHRARRDIQTSPELTAENATLYCKEKLLHSNLAITCRENASVDVDNIIRQCSTDVHLTGDTSYVKAAATLLMDICEENLIKNMSQLKNDTDFQKIVKYVAENLCPNDCSFNGKCSNGTCICKKGFTSADCSAEIGQRPTLFSVQSKGLCDKRKRPCKITTIFGIDFLDSPNLTCHVEEFKIVESPWIANTTVMDYPAKMTDITLVECKLPSLPVKPGAYDETVRGTAAAGLRIAVSNDGVTAHKSERNLDMVSYDSTCLQCNASSSFCFHKDDTSCLINGYCIARNDSNPNNWCYHRVPKSNSTGWTWRKDNIQPKILTPTTRYALLNEDLRLTIESHDPEGRPTITKLISGEPTARFTADNILHWSPKDNKTAKFTFLVADECNATSNSTISVVINQCQCLNGGTCKPALPRGSGTYSCICSLGFTGRLCEANIDDCKPLPCVNGTCVDLINNYHCDCQHGFTGQRCDTAIKYCKNDSCFAGVNCTYVIGGYRCGPCPVGFTGNGINCTANTKTTSPTTAIPITSEPVRMVPSTSKVVSSVIATETSVETITVSSSDVGDRASYTSIPTIRESTINLMAHSASKVVSSSITTQTSVETTKTVSSSDVGNRGPYTSVQPSRESTVEMTTASTVPSAQTTPSLEKGARQSSVTTEMATSSHFEPPLISQPTHTTHVLHQSVSSSQHTSVEATKAVTTPMGTTVKPTEEPLSEVAAEVRLVEIQWSEELQDKKSREFLKLASSFEHELDRVYTKNSHFKKAKVVAFRQGSVIADFILLFNLKQERPLDLLLEEVKHGKLGNFSVDKNSLKTKAVDDDYDKSSFPQPLVLIIGILGGLLAAAIILVVALKYKSKKRRFKKRDHKCPYNKKCDLPDCAGLSSGNVTVL